MYIDKYRGQEKKGNIYGIAVACVCAHARDMVPRGLFIFK